MLRHSGITEISSNHHLDPRSVRRRAVVALAVLRLAVSDG
jgi:hypothetical protein